VSAPPAYENLVERLAQVYDLGKLASLAAWDQRTQMPSSGADARAEQLGTISRLAHEHFVSDEIGELLEEVGAYEETLDYDSTEASLIRFTRREYDKLSRVPSELEAETARSAAIAEQVWEVARRESDFPSFLPHLERNIDLRKQYIACFDKADEDYDHALDDFEPGMTTKEVRSVFDSLKKELPPLIEEVVARQDAVDDSCLEGPWPIEGQHEFERVVLHAFGYSDDSWRIDETEHPFEMSIAISDIRLTTRHFPSSLTAVFATMHEFGHGLYERQVDPSLERTPLARGTSLGLHESQSRMWENLVGRSLPFWLRFYPELKRVFPERLDGVSAEDFQRAVSKVRPSLIRIYADEATYNLHIILRFELEQDLLSGTLAPADLPEAWDAKIEEYFGLEVPDVADGCLQDTHWASGIIGYFPTYALGNIMSAQIWERMLEDVPDVYDRIEQGEFGALRDWLREHLHRFGRMFMPKETLERCVGGPLDTGPYLRYLRTKFGEIYGLPQ
jgi:carboxypeptidase Taq